MNRDPLRAAPSPPSTPPTIELHAPRQQRCQIFVERGLLDRLPDILQRTYAGRRMVVVSDDVVWDLYGERFVDGLRACDARVRHSVMPAGETSKSMATFSAAVQRMHELGLDRRGVIINLGGGTVSDIGGMIAAIYMRGVSYVNVPTTLLAQHDAGIGGKVAVNTPWAKNFLGAFYHPDAVYCDPNVLDTLDERNISAGVAEAIKVALAGQGDLFNVLEDEAAAVCRRDPEALERVVRLAAAHKVALLRDDPYERDLRRVLNLGHSYGHPLEVEMAYRNVLHGEAVGFGLAVATAVGVARGMCPPDTAERIYRLLEAYGLPPVIPRTRAYAAIRRMREIRGVRGQRLHFVVPRGIDEVAIVPELGSGEISRALEQLDERGYLTGSD